MTDTEELVLELCAGYNGLGMAIEAALGARVAAFSEYDKAPSKILAYRYPGVPNYGDMTCIDWAELNRLLGPITVVSGGTPCQDLSHAGKRKGMTEGTRSNLWVQMREAIAIIQPEWVIWENVRGAYSACAESDADSVLGPCPRCLDPDGGANHTPNLRALGRVLGDLSELGYDAKWRGLRAADVGAPHGRFRVFVLARRRSAGNPVSTDVEGSRTAGRTHADQEQSPRPDRSAGNGPTLPEDIGHQRPGKARNRRTGPSNSSQPPTEPESIGREERRTQPAGLEGRPNAPIGSASDIDWTIYAAAIARWERTLGRRAPRPTEPTGRDGAERLSPRFTEWMMGLPDGWVTDPAIGISRTEQLKACGNGVVPQQAYAAITDMLAEYRKES